jgi:uncharacterized membrane protein
MKIRVVINPDRPNEKQRNFNFNFNVKQLLYLISIPAFLVGAFLGFCVSSIIGIILAILFYGTDTVAGNHLIESLATPGAWFGAVAATLAAIIVAWLDNNG